MASSSKFDADAAYLAAEDEIKAAIASNATTLHLDGSYSTSKLLKPYQFAYLDRIPPVISGLTTLEELYLGNNEITDLGPIASVRSLKQLHLDKSKVSDINPLASLVDLRRLYLLGSKVSDLSPLSDMYILEELQISRTPVGDISPLATLKALKSLSLTHTQIASVAPLRNLHSLGGLNLSWTQVEDLSDLVSLKSLKGLFLSHTNVTDVSPLSMLVNLEHLDLDDTQVSDIAPLVSLKKLKYLHLNKSAVRDLRPILSLVNLSDFTPGVGFRDTPATQDFPALHEISRINDAKDRKEKAFAFLSRLPPWPEPLDPVDSPADDPIIPQSVPAPLQVAEVDGMLRAFPTGDGLLPNDADSARQAWVALAEYLHDLAETRGRIANAMPQLGRALSRFETAISTSYDQANPISLGIHGGRIIRLAPEAAEALMPPDAADVAEFAAALALFLQRFPAWRAYRDAAVPVPDPKTISAAIPDVLSFADTLTNRSQIGLEVPEQIVALVDQVQDAPGETVAARGLIDSLTNVVAAVATRVITWVKSESRDVGKVAWVEAKKLAAKAVVTSGTTLTGAAIDIVFNQSGLLRALAGRFPDAFDWLRKFLDLLGL